MSPWVGDVPVQLRVNDTSAASMVECVGGKDLGEVDRLRDTWLKGQLLRNENKINASVCVCVCVCVRACV